MERKDFEVKFKLPAMEHYRFDLVLSARVAVATTMSSFPEKNDIATAVHQGEINVSCGIEAAGAVVKGRGAYILANYLSL